jgi:hypothetical protein
MYIDFPLVMKLIGRVAQEYDILKISNFRVILPNDLTGLLPFRICWTSEIIQMGKYKQPGEWIYRLSEGQSADLPTFTDSSFYRPRC